MEEELTSISQMTPYVEGGEICVLEFKPGTGFDEPFKASSKLQIAVLKTFYPFTILPSSKSSSTEAIRKQSFLWDQQTS
jgi:hypothetical protein